MENVKSFYWMLFADNTRTETAAFMVGAPPDDHILEEYKNKYPDLVMAKVEQAVFDKLCQLVEYELAYQAVLSGIVGEIEYGSLRESV